MFNKILIANRGEIACRIIKTARRLGIATVAVYSDADKSARHVRLADEAVRIGPAPSRDSYLRGDVIIEAARATGAQAVHPGYGFLSENEEFAAACGKAGIVFIGPAPDAIEAMGLKDRAKDIMARAGVPVVPGYLGEKQDADTLQKEAGRAGYPVLIKAVAGGGGKGMRLVESEAMFAEALASCKREALSSFGNDRVMIEKYITRPRHVEVQVFGDAHGNAVYLHERDCSLQRRHQKVVEEAPAPGLPDKIRKKLGEAAVKAVKAIKYQNAGTIEFIMDSQSHDFYFMEMNTRLQVEHPVTEAITGLDLVEWQLRVAAGEKLPLGQKDIPCDGHAFEVRLYAEDPANSFLPQTGRVQSFFHPDVRVDTGIEEGDEVSIHYDPMIAKIITHAPTRAEAAAAMAEALADTILTGLVTNQEFLGNVFRQKNFLKGEVDTGFIARHETDLLPVSYGRATPEDLAEAAFILIFPDGPAPEDTDDIWDRGDNWRMNGIFEKSLTLINRGESHSVVIRESGEGYEATVDGRACAVAPSSGAMMVADDSGVTVFRDGQVIHMHPPAIGHTEDAGGEGRILAPMPGKIVTVMTARGQAVNKGQPLLVMEAMKMEMTIRAGCDGVIDDLPVAGGQQVADGALLVSIARKDAA